MQRHMITMNAIHVPAKVVFPGAVLVCMNHPPIEAFSFDFSTIGFQLFEKRSEHPLYSGHVFIKLFIEKLIEKLKIACKEQMILKFARRTHRYLKKPPKVGITAPSAALCYIS